MLKQDLQLEKIDRRMIYKNEILFENNYNEKTDLINEEDDRNMENRINNEIKPRCQSEIGLSNLEEKYGSCNNFKCKYF